MLEKSRLPMMLAKEMIQGGILMAYSYIVSDTVWMYIIGTALTAWVWVTRHDS